MSALDVRGLTAGYAGVPAVRDLTLRVESGEVVGLLGANGSGKTTALLAIVGAIPASGGTVESFGRRLTGRRTEQIAHMGVALVPDDRGVFPALTVREHMRLARTPGDRRAGECALGMFPQLSPLLGRRCGLLSGGEQQMLAIAKALALRPRVLLIDEMSLGLAPLVVESLLPIIRRLASSQGAAVVIVEQHVDLALRVADRAVVLNRGRVALAGPAADLLRDREAVKDAYFGRAPHEGGAKN